MIKDSEYEVKYRIADSLLHEALEIYKKLDLPKHIMDSFTQLYLLSFNTDDSYKALDYANSALEIAKEHQYTKSIAIIHSNMSLIYIKLGDYQKANEYNYSALSIFQELNDTLNVARCKLSIGTVHFLLKDYPKALANITTARDDFHQINDERGYSICLSNIGLIYIHMEDYKKALHHFFEAVEINKRHNDLEGFSSNYINIGEIYYQLGNNVRAMEYYKQALDIDEKMDDKGGVAIVYQKIAELLTSEDELYKAMNYCNKSIAIFNETADPESKRDALEQLALIHQKLGNYQQALTIYQESSELKDSLFNIDKAAKIAMLEEKYLNEKLAKENLDLKYTNEIQETKLEGQLHINRTYLVTLLILATAMVVTIIQFRKKNIAYKFISRRIIDLINKEKELKNTQEKVKAITEIKKSKISISLDEKEEILARMDKLLEKEKIFTSNNLTIDKLARRLSTNRTYLSQIINDEFGKSYSSFINEYRVKEATKMLSDSEKRNKYTIEAIAKEVGFNSISNFNMVFKNLTGITPSIFLKNSDYQPDRSPLYTN
jgi:AraC-like DNA-binding protein